MTNKNYCNDIDWKGDNLNNPFQLLKNEANLNQNLFKLIKPKQIPNDEIEKYKLNINSCYQRIISLYSNGIEKINELNQEMEILENPEETKYLWDLSIYNIENENNYNNIENSTHNGDEYLEYKENNEIENFKQIENQNINELNIKNNYSENNELKNENEINLYVGNKKDKLNLEKNKMVVIYTG